MILHYKGIFHGLGAIMPMTMEAYTRADVGEGGHVYLCML